MGLVLLALAAVRGSHETTMATVGVIGLSLVGVVARRPSWVLSEPVQARSPRRALAVGAHPDDLELACGGTLARLAGSGHEVHVLVMSHGARGGNGPTRAAQARTSARGLGATSVEVLDLPDTELHLSENEMADAIENAIRHHEPDVVLTHSANDHHQDHRAVHAATLRAARRHRAILCFESPSATDGFRPTVFVDIESQLATKVRAVAAHRDQRAKPYVGAEQVRALATYRGSQARMHHAEGFEAVRMPALLFGDP